MVGEIAKVESGDEVIEMNNVQSSKDVTDAPRRQQNVSTFYHTKKSAAEGMMDISLLTANANQLKFIIFYNQESKTFYAALALIVLSLALQVSIGFLLIFRVSSACCFEYNRSMIKIKSICSVASSRTVRSDRRARQTNTWLCWSFSWRLSTSWPQFSPQPTHQLMKNERSLIYKRYQLTRTHFNIIKFSQFQLFIIISHEENEGKSWKLNFEAEEKVFHPRWK